MSERINEEYEDAEGCVPYDSEEGEYLVPALDNYDLLNELGVFPRHKQLMDALAQGFDDRSWVRRNPFSYAPEDVWRFSWENFCHLVKHKNRYLFFSDLDEDQYEDEDAELFLPSSMLDKIGRLVKDSHLTKRLKYGTRLFRVRRHDAEHGPANSMEDLGPPPVEKAVYANRMSPADVPMLYAAFDPGTALAETQRRAGGGENEVTISAFETTTPFYVLDLTRLPPVPSVFHPDSQMLSLRPSRMFLQHFVSDLTKPVEKDGADHIEYAPAQVVTEYVRFRLHAHVGTRSPGLFTAVPGRPEKDASFSSTKIRLGRGEAPVRLIPEFTRIEPAPPPGP